MAEGYKNFVAGDVLTSAQVDDYLMLQSVMRFADSAARDTALSGVLTEGLLAYLKDVDTVTMYTGSAWRTAFQLGAWTAYTPSMEQGPAAGTPTPFTLTGIAHYTRIGNTIIGNNVLTVTNAGSATNGESVICSMPVAPQDTTSLNMYCGNGAVVHSSVTYPIAVVNYGGAFRFKRTDAGSNSLLGIDPNWATAINDTFSFCFTYEAA